MHPEMQEWVEHQAIAHVRAAVDGVRHADGHLLDPPIYPAYQRQSFDATTDYRGVWVRWFQKDSAESPWEQPRRLVRVADLR